MKACINSDCHFVVWGKGVQFRLLEEYKTTFKPNNLTLINGLPKQEYNKLMHACDVGLVFLRYTAMTPNFPSRILTYMDYSLPIVACTDPVTDLIKVITEGEFGWGCLSNDANKFADIINLVNNSNTLLYGKNARDYLERHFSSEDSYRRIVDCLK